MNKLKKFQVVSCLFVLLNLTSAQAQIRERLILGGQLVSKDTSLRNQVDAWLGDRWLLDQDGNTLLSVGVQLRRSWVAPTTFGTPDQLNMIVPTVTLLHNLNEKWTLVGSLRTGAFGDLKKLGIQDMRVEAAFFADRVYSDTLTIGYGAARSSNFGKVLYLPLLHVLKNFNDKFLLDALLPSRVDLWYFPTPKWEVGFTANIIGSRYRISENAFGITSIGLAQVDAGPAVRYQMFPQMWLGLEAGAGLARRYNLYQGDTEIKLAPGTTTYGRLTYSWRF